MIVTQLRYHGWTIAIELRYLSRLGQLRGIILVLRDRTLWGGRLQQTPCRIENAGRGLGCAAGGCQCDAGAIAAAIIAVGCNVAQAIGDTRLAIKLVIRCTGRFRFCRRCSRCVITRITRCQQIEATLNTCFVAELVIGEECGVTQCISSAEAFA